MELYRSMEFVCMVSTLLYYTKLYYILYFFLVAPFCYLYDSPMTLYFTFRAFYIRFCHRLTTVNTHPQGIVSLCLLFEKLLQTHEPQLWSHLRELQIQP